MKNISKIDITMTATLRPKILQQTLETVVNNIVTNEHEFRLIINIDPSGEKIKQKIILKVAKTYFKDILYNYPKQSSFSKAVKWVWGNSTAPYIFHIEDDWSINRKVDVTKMIGILDKYDKVSSLRLYKYKTPKGKVFSTFGCKWRYNEDGFYIADGWQKQFGLNPILIKRQFIDEVLPKMRDDVNPEKQFRASQKWMAPIIRKWKYALYTQPRQLALVTDIGLGWRKKNKLVKPKGKPFLSWEKN